MAKIAKLVMVTFITRVVVDDSVENPLEDVEFLECVCESIHNQLLDPISQNIDCVMNDTECPYGTFDWEK